MAGTIPFSTLSNWDFGATLIVTYPQGWSFCEYHLNHELRGPRFSLHPIGRNVSASAFGQFASVAPGSWIEIYGSNLATSMRGWSSADFTGVNAPTSLDRTSVTIAGQAAFVDYISPGQVNVQVPNGGLGSQTVIVSNASGSSSAYPITVNAVQPGLLAAPSFNVGGKQYVAALFSAGTTFALAPDTVSRVLSRRA